MRPLIGMFIGLVISFSSGTKSADTMPAKECLPNDPVLTLNEQEILFVEAYQAFKPEEINPISTPIPALKPMIRMYYSYVAGIICNSPSHTALLENFWLQAQNIINGNKLTLANMRCITMQLALLITDFQQGTLREDKKDDHYYKLYKEGLWKDLKNYDGKQFYIPSRQTFPPHPFYCEAVLCADKGGFSYGRFIKNYINSPFVLHIAALTLKNDGPHGGLVAESADYLEHDFGHNEILALYMEHNQRDLAENPLTKDLPYWDTLRSMLKIVYNAKLEPKINETAIYLMLREIIPSLLADKYISILGLKPHEESVPFSQRKLFLGAIADSATFTCFKNLENELLMNVVYMSTNAKKPWNSTKTKVTVSAEKVQQNEDGTFTGIIKINTQSALSPTETMAIHQKPVELATFSVYFDISPTENPLQERVNVLKAGQIQWRSEAASHLTSDEQDTIVQDIKNWEFDGTSDSRYSKYLSKVKDYEKLLRKIYVKDSQLPLVDSPYSILTSAVDLGMKRFWRDFYLINYHLFPDTTQ